MSYESTAEPIKVGYLMDFTFRPGFPEEMFAAFTQTFDIVFEEAVQQGLLDRPVQMIYREVEGLPKGSVKAVIDAYGELVDEGCLVVFGPQHHRQLRADCAKRSRNGSRCRPSASPAPTTGWASGRSPSRKGR